MICHMVKVHCTIWHIIIHKGFTFNYCWALVLTSVVIVAIHKIINSLYIFDRCILDLMEKLSVYVTGSGKKLPLTHKGKIFRNI